MKRFAVIISRQKRVKLPAGYATSGPDISAATRVQEIWRCDRWGASTVAKNVRRGGIEPEREADQAAR
jgi:hypothetical protein